MLDSDMPIKERRTKILLMLLLFGDSSFNPVTLDETLQKIFDISLNQKTKGTISSLIKERLIEKAESQTDDVKPTYKLTLEGFYRLCLEFPFFRFIKADWDGLWRIISYEIPETKREIRDRLRREMRGWGLGPWHRSFWLTPHPIVAPLKELVYGKEEEKYIQSFEATHVFGDMEILVEKVWGKSEMDKRYRELFRQWHEILSAQEEKADKLAKITHLYIQTLRDDPGLPSSLLGKKWIGYEAQDIFREVRGILMK